ncbi:Bicarbonate transport ATP-binding protein CmpD [compost metagenome]
MAVSIPRPRQRSKIIEHPGYYKIRNYLVNFLVERSGSYAGSAAKHPLAVDPAAEPDAKPGAGGGKQLLHAV